ncbi:c-type cytochrome [Nitratireductor pacificus]|uniref:Cytochrome c signal peptide protein n=1 Tax=Nitratireductor pacificus pht-3B TaxID=391937 RepID=K2MGI4_9HYPH|nr:cytochrome c [Nitratireductor pacificus]EKF19810.1 cytochrome c signal peptide protein [Nitratireductor pacificus pht-3B]
MKKLALVVSAICLSVSAVAASDEPVAARKALMDANAASAGLAGAMMKGDLAYNPAIAKAALLTLNASAKTFGSFFPEGSQEGDTTASPKIWEDAAGFQAALDKYMADTSAAVAAAGRDGPADLDAFKAAVGPVLGNCRSCHENFRVQQN